MTNTGVKESALQLKRLPDWGVRWTTLFTQKTIAARQGLLKAGWDITQGQENCCTLAGESTKAITGRDVYQEIMGDTPYTTEVEALGSLAKLGYRSVDQFFGSLVPSIRKELASAGDLVLVPAKEGDISIEENPWAYGIGVVDHNFFWCMSPELGLTKGPMRNAVKAYRIG